MEAILILLAAHFTGDWFLQSRKMATSKSGSFSVALEHGAIVTAVLFLAGLWLFSDKAIVLLFALYNGIAHIIQDIGIWKLYAEVHKHKPSFKWWEDYWFYTGVAVDQLLHLSLLVVTYYWLTHC